MNGSKNAMRYNGFTRNYYLRIFLGLAIGAFYISLLLEVRTPVKVNPQQQAGEDTERKLPSSARLLVNPLSIDDRRLIILVNLNTYNISWMEKLLALHPQVLFLSDVSMDSTITALDFAKRVFNCSDDVLSHVVDKANQRLITSEEVPWCGTRQSRLKSSISGMSQMCHPAPKHAFQKFCKSQTIAISVVEDDIILICEFLAEYKWSLRIVQVSCEEAERKGVSPHEGKVDSNVCAEVATFCDHQKEESDVLEFLNFCDLYGHENLPTELFS